MNYDEREERLFLLRLFKFVFQINRVFLPDDLQREYDRFPNEESSYFSEAVTKAVLILTIEKRDYVDEIPDIGSEKFESIFNNLSRAYNPADFLQFCSWFVMKAALDHVEDDVYAYQTLWSALENMFQRGRERGGFNVETWDEFEEMAKLIVVEEDEKHQRDPNFNPFVEPNLNREKAFVLRVMQCVFRLHDQELPEYCADNLCLLDQQHYQLTAEVRSALKCIKHTISQPEYLLGEVALRNYYYEMTFYRFKPREFLEYCFVFSKKAVKDYYEFDIGNTPIRVFEACVKILRGVRIKGLFTPWGKIEGAALDIVDDYLKRREDERLKEQRLRDLTEESRRRIYESLKAQFGDADPPEEWYDSEYEKYQPLQLSELVLPVKPDTFESDESGETGESGVTDDSGESAEPCDKKKRKLTVMYEPEVKKKTGTVTADEQGNTDKPISNELNEPESTATDEPDSDETVSTEVFEMDERQQSEIVNSGQEKVEDKLDHINCSCCLCS